MTLSWIKKYKIELIIFFVAFLVRIFYAVIVQWLFGSHVFISFSDAANYLHMAQTFLQYHTISQATDSPFLLPDPLRTPIYPLFLALFVLFKLPIFTVVLVQNILVGFIAVIIYRLGIKLFESRSIGIVASVIFCFEPMSIYWNNLLMSETLASFFFIFAIYLFVSKRYYLSAVMLGLATLTRPVNLYFLSLAI